MRSWLLFLVCLQLLLSPVSAQSEAPEELFVPILINGMVDQSWHYQTIFRFIELSGTTPDAAVAVVIEAFDNSGKPIDSSQLFCPPALPQLPPFQISLPGSGAVHFGTKGFIQPYDPVPGIIDGWARLTLAVPGRVQATAEVLQVDAVPAGCPPLVCARPSMVYRSDAVVNMVKPSRCFRAPVVITPYRHTAFSVINTSKTESAHVVFALNRPNGYDFQGGGLIIPPMQRRSAFAWEWATFPAPFGFEPWPKPNDFYGAAWIVSNVPVVVGALQVLLPEGKLVTATATPATCPDWASPDPWQ